MCSICGILGNPSAEILRAMNEAMAHRGPDQTGEFIQDDIAFAHNRLAVIDIDNGKQPMTRVYRGQSYTIVYNGELYNTPDLRALVCARGISPQSYCDTEIVLYLYILFGKKCAAMLNGIFAFAIYDEAAREVYLARDRYGIKPLFYALQNGSMIFASEVKALLAHPSVRPIVDRSGLWQLLFLSPVRLSGGIFRDVLELEPAHQGIWRDGRFQTEAYWRLEAKKCMDTRGEIIDHTRDLIYDAIRRQMVSDVPLCTLLSGGLDSSIISAVAAEYDRERGKQLTTYSFEYEGNRESFHASLFQPQSDDDYALYMADWLKTNHHVLTASTRDVFDALIPAALARDFPGQADIDSSLLYYCRLIKREHTVAVSGECADEIFGGYPWFYRPEMLENPFFPWIHQPMLRASLFRDDFAHAREGYDWLSEKYRESMANCPTLDGENESMRQSRLATWLSVNFFMASLLERKDRMSMASSVEVRVPFADHRILEYVFNVPWEIKFEQGREKALLRNAAAGWLPEKILNRKKSPYPKTQNPAYEAAVLAEARSRLERKDSALHELIDRKSFDSFVNSDNGTWFGQLMSKAQLLAWLIQFDAWVQAGHVDFTD